MSIVADIVSFYGHFGLVLYILGFIYSMEIATYEQMLGYPPWPIGRRVGLSEQ